MFEFYNFQKKEVCLGVNPTTMWSHRRRETKSKRTVKAEETSRFETCIVRWFFIAVAQPESFLLRGIGRTGGGGGCRF